MNVVKLQLNDIQRETTDTGLPLHITNYFTIVLRKMVEQCGGLNSVLKLVRQASTPPDTSRLLMRALAVLCSVSKGCLSLLALGGLDVVLSCLSGDYIAISVEAAGVLTQLTNVQHSFIQLHNVGPILNRLLGEPM
ncbi:hypothetical protein NECAME_14444 [Necator americanus]|uniref:Uncharacterized protein n=1 Tax=Necator americanus TaxID=51031 RepID=W2SMS0_NECAM|nr:hypothetical protein NECAME_14444 [Necator americanus]ETN70940.1 hypothetical protein NECAME_14444 [Necator americanus]